MPYEMASMYLSGRIENGGPAYARNLVWIVAMKRQGAAVDEPHRYAHGAAGAW